jgi:ABC-2 type transport system permease protein
MPNGLLRDVRLLLMPRTRPLLRGRSSRGGPGRRVVLGVAGALFWCGLFGISWRVLRYFKGIEDIGDLLAFKLLSMILVVSFALLLFSGILTSLARLFLSRDLLLVHSLPVADHRIFIARWIDTTADSSWMVIVFTMPVFLAYGLAFGAGTIYYAGTLLALFLLAVTASALSAVAVMIGVMIVPATRMRSIVILLGILLFAALYLAIRLMRPEQLVDPAVFDSVLA